jgi:hypothetical protein
MRVQVLQRMALAKRGKALALVAIALSVGGCAKEDGDEHAVPIACKEGPDTVGAALARAPARVELDGTLLSECFTRGSDGADLQQVGASYLSVAAGLADGARLRPGGDEALRLGYLVGAVKRGAAGTQGVHDELARRIEQETIGVDTRSPAYMRGYRAGRSRG